ncbi:uncharacterized protein LOC129727019 isoform X2 [Wyeomyia smithii]|uniref:uncharacterized protein LOC129727019 isoform X2 n=1 Tax=Wyeomyia smithii TaxID=174621 RepID=UPI00246808CA|nr:uncharacterized protein LOC129727019 isoform X2 [Wyeomyia smithii]
MLARIVILLQLCCLVVVTVVSGENLSKVLSNKYSDDDQYNVIPCGETICDPFSEVCEGNTTCQCMPNFKFDPEYWRCCPVEGMICSGCCYGDAICFAGRCNPCYYRDQHNNCIVQDSMFFLTAAQVAFATAIVIGVTALATLLYKTARARARRRNANQRTLESEQSQPRVSRLSLSSIQIRVLRRLRDRPPKYETRHNYEFRQRDRTSPENQQRRHDTSPVSTPTGDPPPAYDGDVSSVRDFPPPYSVEPSQAETRIAIIGEQSVPSHDAPECTLDSHSNACNYVPFEGDSLATSLERAELRGIEELKIKLDDEHKTLHI